MSYFYNPHRHVKIWLSQDPNIFLNLENQLRLIKMRSLNPLDFIHFIYDSSLLSTQTLDGLTQFCIRHFIIALDVQKDIIPFCWSPEEKQLIQIYQDEIENLTQGGNLAAASDILRWLKPIYTLGTYSDFDTTIDTRCLPSKVEVQSSILFNIGSIVTSRPCIEYENLIFNNDIIAVVDPAAAEPAIQKIQTSIYDACYRWPFLLNQGHSVFSAYLIRLQSHLVTELGLSLAKEILIRAMPELNDILFLLNALGGASLTARELRKKIIHSTKDNWTYCQMITKIDHWLDKEQAMHLYANALRKKLNQFVDTSIKIQEMLMISNDQELIETMCKNTRFLLLKNSVIHTTGPNRLISALSLKYVYRSYHEFMNTVAPYALTYYALDKAFRSKQAYSIREENTKFQKIMNANCGEYNDVSWLSEGQHWVRVRELKIEAATQTIQRYFRRRQQKMDAPKRVLAELVKMRERITAHIIQIKQEWGGMFRLYYDQARRKKIEALETILNYFQDDHFDAKAFEKKMKTDPLNEIFANLDQGQMKELIDRLIMLSRQAMVFSLTDQRGIVAFNRATGSY